MKKEVKDKGKQNKGMSKVGPSRRGRNFGKEIMENLFDAYGADTSSQVKSLTSGWERDCQTKEEGEIQEEAMEFLKYPSNTRSRVSLFQQYIHSYWTMKYLLVKDIVMFKKLEGIRKLPLF